MPGNRARNPLVDDAAEDDEDEVEESEEVRRAARVPRLRSLIFPPQEEEIDLEDLDAGAEYVENLMEEMDREGHQALLHEQRMDAENTYNHTNDPTLNRVANDMDNYLNSMDAEIRRTGGGGRGRGRGGRGGRGGRSTLERVGTAGVGGRGGGRGGRGGRGSRSTLEPQRMQVSVTISVKGKNMPAVLWDRAQAFNCRRLELEPEFRSHICVEKGGQENHLHIQGVMDILSTSSHKINADLRAALKGPTGILPAGLGICVRQLTGIGLHTWLGILGYCQKDQFKDHYKMHQVGNIFSEGTGCNY